MRVIGKTDVKKVFRRRGPWCHKGDFGSLLVIGGSVVYSGSPAFAALAALRAGCDLVTIASPERAADIIASFSPDLITCPLRGDFLSGKHLAKLRELSEGKDAVAIGNGLGRREETLLAVNGFLKWNKTPAVIDADAIHAVAKNRDLLKKNYIITPHIREFYALSGVAVTNDISERAKTVKKVASLLGCTILLKGHADVISDGISVALNKTGTPRMTVGGTGDTLAGIAGSLLAQGTTPFNAACTAAYINGRAGELAAREKKYLASDLLGRIAEACG